jgi:hypothetical protein
MLKPAQWHDFTPREKAVLIPIAPGPIEQDQVKGLLQSNPVLKHLTELAAKTTPDLSLSARLFTVRDQGPEGVYRPGYALIQRPMFPDPKFIQGTLAHEIVHAILSEIREDWLDDLVQQLLPQLNIRHPSLYNVTLPIFYADQLVGEHSNKIATEESLSFMVGALAAELDQMHFLMSTRPMPTRVDDWIFFNEPLLTADVEMLGQLGLIPAWMKPSTLGYGQTTITRKYYDTVRAYQRRK